MSDVLRRGRKTERSLLDLDLEETLAREQARDTMRIHDEAKRRRIQQTRARIPEHVRLKFNLILERAMCHDV